MPELILRFLGPPEIVLDGVPVHLPRQRSLALLAYLVLSGRPHGREELATILSGEAASSQERKLLRNALTTLAEQLGDYLITDRQTIAFNTALPYHLDLATLGTLLDEYAAPDVAGLEWAVARYDSELLAGLNLRDAPLFEAWLVRTREHTRQQLVQLAHRLLEHYQEHGNIEQGIALARRLLESDPCRESIHRRLMRLLARNGERAAALEQFELCRQALATELGVEPQAETLALHERLLGPPFAPRHNLPAPTDALIGRDAEVADIVRLLLAPDCRLVTIAGLGGSGKSRVAQAVAAHFIAPRLLVDDHPFADGCFLVDLAGISGAGGGDEAAGTDERRLAMAIGLALGLVFYAHVDRVDQLLAYLQTKRMLLILDGLERLVAGVAVLRRILAGAPGVNLLVTTRIATGIHEEHLRLLGRLALPADPDSLEQAPASQLFLSEAGRLDAHLTPDDRAHVVAICRLVNGLPLALVIAASWLRTLSCAQIARDLEHGGKLLSAAMRGQTDRREGLDSILAFTWRSLAARDRRALCYLSVFEDRFDHLAVEAIGVELLSLRLLCEHALVERDGDSGYLLHPLVRQYARARLARWPVDEARIRSRHAAYYAAIIAGLGPQLFVQPEAHIQVGMARLNALRSWDWAVEHLDLGLLSQLRDGLSTWHLHTGLQHEWIEILEATVARLHAALAQREDPALRVTLGWILAAAAEALVRDRQPNRAYPLLDEARQCARTVGMIPLEARALLGDGLIRLNWGEYRAAREPLREALALARATRDSRTMGEALSALAVASIDTGHFAEAETQVAQATQAFREAGDRLLTSQLTIQHARVNIERGEFARARGILDQGLHLIQAFGDRWREWQVYIFRGIICDIGMGMHREADEQFTQGLSIARETGDHRAIALANWARGRNALHAGDFARAGAILPEALTQAHAVGSPFALSRVLRTLGQLAFARGETDRAEEFAQQALQLAIDAGHQQKQATALILLGRIHEHHELLPEAAAAQARALALARGLAMPGPICDAQAGLASVALAEGEVGEGAIHAIAILEHLETASLAGCEEPGWVALTCYRALRAARDRRAGEALRLGAAVIERRVAALVVNEQARYLKAFPERQQLLDAWHESQGGAQRAGGPISLFQPTQARAPEGEADGTRTAG